MPAKSKKQQQYFGMVEAGKIPPPKGMTKQEVHKFAATKSKNLPAHVASSKSEQRKKQVTNKLKRMV